MGTAEKVNNYKRIQPFVEILDSTLRDGAQGEGISYSVQDKISRMPSA